MGITEAIIGVIVLICSGLAAFLGHTAGKSSGVKQGQEQAAQEVELKQVTKAAEASKDRTDVDQAVSRATDDDLDERMRGFYREDGNR